MREISISFSKGQESRKWGGGNLVRAMVLDNCAQVGYTFHGTVIHGIKSVSKHAENDTSVLLSPTYISGSAIRIDGQSNSS